MMSLVEKTLEEEMAVALGVPAGEVREILEERSRSAAEEAGTDF